MLCASASLSTHKNYVKMHSETLAIRGQMDRTDYREHSPAMYLTSSFTFPNAELMADTFAGLNDDIIYSRYNNPSVDEFINKVCQLEGAEEGFATASGMAAVFASMAALLRSGDHVLASRAVFGSTHQILTQIFPKWGITYTYVDPEDIDNWEQHIQPTTRMLVLESPSNPGLALIDLEKAGALCKKHGIIFNIDNCFATPCLQTPTEYGADLIVHSATKFMDGQGRVLGGVITGTKELIAPIRFFCRHTGPSMSPFNAWVISKSLETLEIRMAVHCQNALKLAKALEKIEGIKNVKYPFLQSHPQYALAKKQMRADGAMITFEVDGDFEKVNNFTKKIKLVSLTSNLGDSRTTMTNPATTTHSKLPVADKERLGITTGLMRVSVGLEDVNDLIKDFKQALK